MKAATGSQALPSGFQNHPVPRHSGTVRHREAPPTAPDSRWHEKPGIGASNRPQGRRGFLKSWANESRCSQPRVSARDPPKPLTGQKE